MKHTSGGLKESERGVAWRLERVIYEIGVTGTVTRVGAGGSRRVLALSAKGEACARVLLEDAIGPLPSAYAERLAHILVRDALGRPLPGEPARLARRDLIAWLSERAECLIGQRFQLTHERILSRVRLTESSEDSSSVLRLAAVRAPRRPA